MNRPPRIFRKNGVITGIKILAFASISGLKVFGQYILTEFRMLLFGEEVCRMVGSLPEWFFMLAIIVVILFVILAEWWTRK